MVILDRMLAKRRMTQQELSNLTGIPQQTISAIVTGARKNPGVLTCARLARALRCTVDDLIVDDAEHDISA